jgi:transcription antitermination factor NusA-like protein
VVVPDYQLSLAIGREGQNARLAARLTGWRIDIRSDAAADAATGAAGAAGGAGAPGGPGVPPARTSGPQAGRATGARAAGAAPIRSGAPRTRPATPGPRVPR